MASSSSGPCLALAAPPTHADGDNQLVTQHALAGAGGASLTLAVAPHEGFVFADILPDRGVTVIIGTRTAEQADVHGLAWQLEFDADGIGCLADTESESVRLVGDILSLTVSVQDGQLFLVEFGQGEAVSLFNEVRRYEDGEAFIQHGPSSATAALPFYRLAYKRGGMHVYWCLAAVYSALGLRCFKGYASKWAYEGFRGWSARSSPLKVI